MKAGGEVPGKPGPTITIDFGPLADTATPESLARLEERRELFRIAAQSALNRSRGGRDLDPDARRWALHWARVTPLVRALSTGEPAPARVWAEGQL